MQIHVTIREECNNRLCFYSYMTVLKECSSVTMTLYQLDLKSSWWFPQSSLTQCSSCAEIFRAGYSTAMGLTPEEQKDRNPLPGPPLLSGHGHPSQLGVPVAGSCPAPRHQHPQVLLGRSAFSLVIPEPVPILALTPTQLQHLALGIVKPHKITIGPALELVQAPLKDRCSSGVSTAPLNLVSSANTLRVHLIS